MRVEAPPLGPPPPDPRLDEAVRGFVSWHLEGRLVGCIGLVESTMPLRDFVVRFAVQAGLHDRRTPPLEVEQLDRLDFELHLLSAEEPMLDASGERLRGLEAIASALEAGRDGLWLTHPSGARAFYLPSVWEQLSNPRDFVQQLARKAGLDPHAADCDECTGAVLRAWTLHDYANSRA
jgi:AmmeMemoRadiSam system protein A